MSQNVDVEVSENSYKMSLMRDYVPTSIGFMIAEANKSLAQLDKKTQSKLKGHQEQLRPFRLQQRALVKELRACFNEWNNKSALTNTPLKKNSIYGAFLVIAAIGEIVMTETALLALDISPFLTKLLALTLGIALILAAKFVADTSVSWIDEHKTYKTKNDKSINNDISDISEESKFDKDQNYPKPEARIYGVMGLVSVSVLLIAMAIARHEYYVDVVGRSTTFTLGLDFLHIGLFAVMVFIYSRMTKFEHDNAAERRYKTQFASYKRLLAKHDKLAKYGNDVIRQHDEERAHIIHDCFSDINQYLRTLSLHSGPRLSKIITLQQAWFKPTKIDKNLFINLDKDEQLFTPDD